MALKQQGLSTLSSLWQQWTKPHHSITRTDEQRRARLISGLGIVLILALVFGTLAAVGRGSAVVQFIATLSMLGIFLLSRTRFSNLAGILMIVTTSVPSMSYFLSESQTLEVVPVYASAIWLALPLVIGGLILPLRGAMIVNLIILGNLLITKFIFVPNLETGPFWNAFAFLCIVAIVMIVMLRIREFYLIRPQLDELIRANKVKDEFLATMSHELRTPLNSVIGYSSILLNGLRGEIDDEARELIGNIARSSDQLLTLIADILDISKIEAGKVDIALTETALHELHQQWESTFSELASQKGVSFSMQVTPDVPSSIQTDGARLTQIVTNLLTNAIKFTDEGEVGLSLARHRNNLLITVQDSGIGIPEDQLDGIFDKFKQVDSSSQRMYEGTGLGLAITKRLVSLLGGTIQVASILGKGSTFTVSLPIHQSSTISTLQTEKAYPYAKHSA